MESISNYMDRKDQRQLLNQLTKKTFGFSFESWYTGGYYEGDYIPHSLVEEGVMLSNVSANRMTFLQNGTLRHYIQLGTVMTEENHRRQGLARDLMERVLEIYTPNSDGIYLFGDLSAMGFYEKMGFRQVNQYLYHLKKGTSLGKGASAFRPLLPQEKPEYLAALRSAAPYAALDQVNKFSLHMFYTAGLSNVFYDSELQCYVVLEREGEHLILQSVICPQRHPLETILSRLGEFGTLELGFVPLAEDSELFDGILFDGGDDYRLFCLGDKLSEIESQKLYFPLLSHA